MAKKAKPKHLGPHQRRIIKILKKTPNLTILAIAKKLYGDHITVGSVEYHSTAVSLQRLTKRGFLIRVHEQVTFRVKGEE